MGHDASRVELAYLEFKTAQALYHNLITINEQFDENSLQGGILGEIHRGQLFPALEGALFALRAGELSGIVESPQSRRVGSISCAAMPSCRPG